jgi:hypothetical protein
MNLSLSCEEKFKILESNKTKFIEGLIDTVYDEFIEEHKEKFILQLLNKILEEVGAKPVADVLKFKIIIGDLMKINGENFIKYYNIKLLINI